MSPTDASFYIRKSAFVGCPRPVRVKRCIVRAEGSITLHCINRNIFIFESHSAQSLNSLANVNLPYTPHIHTQPKSSSLLPVLITNMVPQRYCRIAIMTEWVLLSFYFKTSLSAYLLEPPAVNKENLAKVYRHRLDSLSKEHCRMLSHVMRTSQIHSLRGIQVSKLLMH